jgi:drug/metabolite transporter (DMT)-like permease
MRMSTNSSANKWPLAQFVTLAVVWGASFLFIAIGLEGLSPAQVVLGRLGSGAVALAAISLARRQKLPAEPVVWAHLAVVAVLLCVAPFLLYAWAEQTIGSGLASIYNATTPLMTTLVALVALPQERPTKVRLLGLLAGFLGVLIVLGPWRGAGGGSWPPRRRACWPRPATDWALSTSAASSRRGACPHCPLPRCRWDWAP